MHTLARPLVREARLKRKAAIRAFTLIELLTVIGIIAILAAITFGVIKGVNERAAISQAKAELSSMAQALEAYKLQYGDYPQAGSSVAAATATTVATTNTQYILLNALVGKLGPTGVAIAGKTFIEASRFTLLSSTALPDSTSNTPVVNALIDPWGRLYMYYYKNSASPTTWTNSSYILYSCGPDGLKTDPTAAGVIDYTNINNVDNVFSNR